MLRGDLPSVSAFGGTWEWFVCHGQLRDLCPLSVPGWDIGVNQIVHVAPTELTGSICSISDLEYLMESIVWILHQQHFSDVLCYYYKVSLVCSIETMVKGRKKWKKPINSYRSVFLFIMDWFSTPAGSEPVLHWQEMGCNFHWNRLSDSWSLSCNTRSSACSESCWECIPSPRGCSKCWISSLTPLLLIG